MPNIPPLVIGRVSYIGNSPVVVMALGGVGQGFDTMEEAVTYLVQTAQVTGQQLFQLVDGRWLELKRFQAPDLFPWSPAIASPS